MAHLAVVKVVTLKRRIMLAEHFQREQGRSPQFARNFVNIISSVSHSALRDGIVY